MLTIQNSAANLKSTETPCVGVCSTIYGDHICRGCFRSAQEVVDWNAYQAEQKLLILSRLNQLITDTLKQSLHIFDQNALKRQCHDHNVRIREDFSPYTWAHALLREGLHDIKDVKKYGIEIAPNFNHLSIAKLIEQIDDALYTLSHAIQNISID